MKKRILLLTLIVGLLFTEVFASGITRYVSPAGNSTSPYTSLTTAANNIMDAVLICNNGDIVMVDDGTYILSTNIIIEEGITVKSINGKDFAIIDGNNTVRCFYIDHNNAIVDGFTIQNGYNPSGFGGGVNIDDGGTLKNCTVKNNQARDGGGIAIDNGGLVENCYILDNNADNNGGSGYGGGVRLLNGGEIRNCVITGNTSVKYGGGVNVWNSGMIMNCVIAKNTAPHGAGIRTRQNAEVYNSIIYYNIGDNYEVSGAGYHYYNSCTTPALPSSYSTNCISSIPMFTATTSGAEDYRLLAASPCIDVGMNFGWMGTVPDLDGNTRIENGIVDMGPYESLTAPTDTDGDGVADVDDDYPNDPDRAIDNYYPANGYGTLAYEDLWPAKGDYDFNDLVCDYKFQMVTNSSNNIVEVFGTFIIKAFGAGFENGFGFQLANDNISNSDITVTGYDLQEGYISLNGNGTEAGQTIPTIIVYDNSFNLMPHPGEGIGVNTDPPAPYVTPDTISVYMDITDNIYTLAQLDIPNFNPFIIVNLERGVEVHLPNYEPTDLVDVSYFGTYEDDSDLSTGRYYKTENNLPWAINIYQSFEYPEERVEIIATYLHFVEWAESGGTLFTDWYNNTDAGYRNNANIYVIP